MYGRGDGTLRYRGCIGDIIPTGLNGSLWQSLICRRKVQNALRPPPRPRHISIGGVVHGASDTGMWNAQADKFAGPVEVDETWIGGKEHNKHEAQRLNAGRGPFGKTPVVGMKDRDTGQVSATPMEHTDKLTLQAFVQSGIEDGAKVYTDEHHGYRDLPNHETVKHSVKEYMHGQAHTNGVESFWAGLKRG